MMPSTDPGAPETMAARQATYPTPAPHFRDPRLKSPLVAAVLSLMPGLGQVYVGYYPRGFLHCIVVAGVISVLYSTTGEPAYLPLLGLFLAFFWLYNVIDAARLAALYNRVLSGGREPDLPEGFELPGIGGSIVGGSILILAGFAVLLHTRWGVSLDWVEEWWPVFPMLFGAYLLGKAIRERQRGAGPRS
jgi:hypothetical protein